MRRNLVGFTRVTVYLWVLLSLMLLSYAAPVRAADPSGAELIAKMEAAVKALKSAQLTVTFQIASEVGPVKGSIEFWGQRPDQLHAQFKSEDASLDGLEAVSDGQQFWAYSPFAQLVIVADRSTYRMQMADQPELREIASYADEIVARGFADTQATNLGSEQINGRDTYKVEVIFAPSAASQVDLEGVTVTFWIDQATYLPQRIEVSVQREEFTMSGFIAVEGTIETDQTLAAEVFTFVPPEGTTVVDLADLPSLPVLSGLPEVQ